MRRLFFLSLSMILFFTACNKAGPSPSSGNGNDAVTEKVNDLYTQYGTSNEALYHQSFSDSLFSPDLKRTLETAINTSKADIEKVKNSDHPDEKPLLFEGAVFSSLYEGYTGYRIKSTNISADKATADAAVEFEYTASPPKMIWTDHVNLVNSKQGWKIDNIIFDTIAHSKDLKTTLNEFIKNAQ
ncbi:DUF3828 domain-containing protein [Chryseobacterium vaccae]|uniref:DUF3828 domain-containing protein n=1 Tax=Chryseobacterium vaccae TaxID=2604424 RepID=UPI001295406D|nr:DUF3828 domain-containing protein [Chryseobacterium vaccae]